MSVKVNFLGVEIDNMRCEEALDRIQAMLVNGGRQKVFFVNAHCINTACSDAQYRADLRNADLVLPDGSGLLIGSRILKRPILENLNGTDLLPKICKLAARNSLGLYLLGGKNGVAEAAAERLIEMYPGIRVVGKHHGYFSEDESHDIVRDINNARPDILLVAMGVPLQEKWAARHIDDLDVKVCFAVGGLLDFMSERVSRAPSWLRRIGMEWMWRLWQEPRRLWKRYLIGNFVFMGRVLGIMPVPRVQDDLTAKEWALKDRLSMR